MKAIFQKNFGFLSLNAPTTFIFSLMALILWAVNNSGLFPLNDLLTFNSYRFDISDFSSYLMFFYPFAHINFEHLINNLGFILLLGPLLEDRYGHKTLFTLIFITHLVITFIIFLLGESGISGLSGISYMMIIMGSLSQSRDNKVPISFILVSFLYISLEVINMRNADNTTANSVHLIGGLCGIIFGMFFINGSNEQGSSGGGLPGGY